MYRESEVVVECRERGLVQSCMTIADAIGKSRSLHKLSINFTVAVAVVVVVAIAILLPVFD